MCQHSLPSFRFEWLPMFPQNSRRQTELLLACCFYLAFHISDPNKGYWSDKELINVSMFNLDLKRVSRPQSSEDNSTRWNWNDLHPEQRVFWCIYSFNWAFCHGLLTFNWKDLNGLVELERRDSPSNQAKDPWISTHHPHISFLSSFPCNLCSAFNLAREALLPINVSNVLFFRIHFNPSSMIIPSKLQGDGFFFSTMILGGVRTKKYHVQLYPIENRWREFVFWKKKNPWGWVHGATTVWFSLWIAHGVAWIWSVILESILVMVLNDLRELNANFCMEGQMCDQIVHGHGKMRIKSVLWENTACVCNLDKSSWRQLKLFKLS